MLATRREILDQMVADHVTKLMEARNKLYAIRNSTDADDS
jgi:hypothetical protein